MEREDGDKRMQLDHQHRYPQYPQQARLAPAIPQPPALAPGTLLAQGRYLIQGYIGGGGFGHIYRAQDTMLHHCRAVKEAFSSDLHARRQFQLEAEFLLNVRHSNLVSAYAVFEENSRLYLVMDYVDGLTLEDIAINHIRKTGRPLNEAQVLDWIIPICDAATALHRQPVPIIHRDIKPANIKLSISTGKPVLMDLGLAKLYERGTHTIGAALAFTPGYAPPEQYQAAGATDQRTDVYGLGATLYYLLTGYQPTEAPARLSAQALRAPIVLNPAVSKRTNANVLRAMELDPAARQQTASELAEALTAAHRALVPLGAFSGPQVPRRAVSPRRTDSGGWFCVSCGTRNRANGRFCQQCGMPSGLSEHIEPDNEQGVIVAAPAETALPPSSLASSASPVSDAAPIFPPADGTPTTPASHRVVLPRHPETGPSLANAPLARPAPAGLPPVSPTPLRMPWSMRLYTPASQREAWGSIFALLAVVCVTISLTGFLARPMLLFVIPTLVLGYWCLRQRQVQMEFRWLAAGALGISVFWVFFWVVLLLAGHF
ncbi:MAG TPA: protein kinase [Ktedonobacterales bacterium]|nr:protein kinase [Ktedonobacterales bacterium]